MKKINIFLVVYFCSNLASAQVDSSTLSSVNAGWGTLDYAVPESPAFKLLGTNPDNILQPTSVKSIALSVGDYYLTNGSSIPKNLAVEISPLLLNSKASLNDYNNNKFLYRMRLSVGTSIADNGAYSIAEGLRFTIIDKTDLRSNEDALNYFYNQAQKLSAETGDEISEYFAANPSDCKNTIDCGEKYANDTAFKSKVIKWYKSTHANERLNTDSVSIYRNAMRKKLWNAEICEIGIAAVQMSPDSSVNNLTFSKIGSWLTYGNHFSKNDQILLGAKLGLTDSLSKLYPTISIGARYYYGNSEYRAFVQFEYHSQNNVTGLTSSIGCVFNITNGLWGQFAMSFIGNNGKVAYSPGFNIGLGTPEKKKTN